MCQIIGKPAGLTIPKELIASTCLVNADGFGYMRFQKDSKELIIEKFFDGTDNDVDKIYPIMEDLHDDPVFFHFRYKTKGPISEEACHPFVIYDDNDRKVALMHNGTLHGYGDDQKVDSQDFGERIIAPLYDKFLRAGTRNPLKDEFFHDIVRKFVGGTDSKIIVLDNTGDTMSVNSDKGTWRVDEATGKKYWVSNTYSFNRSHRTGSGWNKDVDGNSYGVNGWWDKHNVFHQYTDDFDWENIPWEKGSSTPVIYGRGGTSNSSASNFTNQNQNKTNSTGSTSGQTTSTPSQTKTENTGASDTTSSSKSQEENRSFELPMPTPRKSYWKDVLAVDSIEDAMMVTQSQIDELVDSEPENAKLFIRDLITELHFNHFLEDDITNDE